MKRQSSTPRILVTSVGMMLAFLVGVFFVAFMREGLLVSSP